MRRILIMMAMVIALPVICSAQAQITTKKMKIADFQSKTLKVVLSGNTFVDGPLQDEMRARWHVSPYEFCDADEFDKLKTNASFYFLMVVKGQFRKESQPGIEMLSVVKGGPEAADGISGMMELVNIPFRAADFPDGRELVFLPALIDIIQDYVLLAMQTNIKTVNGLGYYNVNLARAKSKHIMIASEDLPEGVSVKQVSYMDVLSSEDADRIMMAGTPDMLVSYTVAPESPEKGAVCYKMLVDAGSHELYYFRRHVISKKSPAGFLPDDLKRLGLAR